MNFEIKIDSSFKEPKVIILTDKMSEEVTALAARLSEDVPQLITGIRDGTLKILGQDEIIRIYTSGAKITAATQGGEYTLRQRLYEMEQRLDGTKFVRISNSEIINLRLVKSFDLSLAGTIRVTLSDESVTYVSRRYVTKIKKVLGV